MLGWELGLKDDEGWRVFLINPSILNGAILRFVLIPEISR